MKILFLTHRFHPDLGGIEVNSEVLAVHFSRQGHSVTVVTWTQGADKADWPFQICRSPTAQLIWRLVSQSDVIFENNICLRLAWPSVLSNKPSVIALRTWVSRTDRSIGWADRMKACWLRRASKVIAVSHAVAEHSWPPASVIGNPYRNEMFRILDKHQKKHGFVFLGRLVSDKGVDLAIRLLHQLTSVDGIRGSLKIPSDDTQLTIVGDGPERENLEALCHRLVISDRVNFTGNLTGDPLVKQLNRHRFLLVPSRWEEPFGNIVLEAMACGCIPIVSDGGGLPDAVGPAGKTFKRGDLNNFIDVTSDLMNDTDEQQRLRDAAENHLANHTPEHVAARYLEVIEQAVAKN